MKADARLEELCKRQLELQKMRDEANEAFWADLEEEEPAPDDKAAATA